MLQNEIIYKIFDFVRTMNKQKIVIPAGIGSRPASWTTVLIG